MSKAEFSIAAIRELRARTPVAIQQAFSARRRRELHSADGRLMLIAADHPARGALGVGGNPMAMANREQLLKRLAIALTRPGVDGVLGTSDILDDLALLGLLDDKIVVGSMNRGGLAGASFEMDDRFTGYDIGSIVRAGLDFAKVLLRVNLNDPGTVRTLERAGQVVTAAAAARIPIMLEPFMSDLVAGRPLNRLDPNSVITSIAIASGLGGDSSYSWLKLPVVADMDRVMAGTTLPTLLLGGDLGAAPEETYKSWANALALPGVRGLVVGRSMLFPKDDNVAAAVDVAASLVHES